MFLKTIPCLFLIQHLLWAADGRLLLDVRDYFGHPIEEVEIEVVGIGQFAFSPGQAKELKLPPGDYNLRASADGFDDVRLGATVKTGRSRVAVAMPLGSLVGSDPASLLTGSIDHADFSPTETRIRIIAVYGDDSLTVFPDPSGAFSASLKHGGYYLVAVFAGSQLCATNVVKLTYNSQPLHLKCVAHR
jgi:hypothetical protein